MKTPPLGEGNSNPVNRGNQKVSPCYWPSSLLSSVVSSSDRRAVMSLRDMIETHFMVRAAYERDGKLRELTMNRDEVRARVWEDGKLVEKVFPVEPANFKQRN